MRTTKERSIFSEPSFVIRVTKLDSLKIFLEEQRYILVERAIEDALSTCADHEIDPEKKNSLQKKNAG